MKLSDQYQNTRGTTMRIIEPLFIEDYIPQPAPFVSPPRWVLGHTTWFFEEMVLKRFKKDYSEFHSQYGFLFNSYYNTLGERTIRQSRGDLSRPTVDEVVKYRRYIDQQMVELLSKPGIADEVISNTMVGINHEQQHQELLYTDLKYTFSVNPMLPSYSDKPMVEESEESSPGFINIPEGVYSVGFEGDGFCFDNELTNHKVYLNKYEISRRLVTNGEYIEFITDNGYKRFGFWHEEGLAWIKENSIKHPMYWQIVDGKWHQFTLAGLREVDPDHILTHISYFEAAAFARWRGMRLPTEFEWEHASGGFNWGKRWEWTESAYLPYPGYSIADGALGEYNGKFMVNQKVLRGSSVVTPAGHSRKTYRNFFHPHIAYQFNGIRLVK